MERPPSVVSEVQHIPLMFLCLSWAGEPHQLGGLGPREPLRMPPTGKGDGMNWEIGIDIYILLYIKWIINENLLYSSGNSNALW